MYTQNLPTHLVRALGPPRLAAGILVTLALFSAAACSNDAASRITSPPPNVSFGKSASPSLSGGTLKFAVLANAAVNCTGGAITGDVGTFSATVTVTGCPITGTTHVGDKAAINAYNNFVNTYDALAPQLALCTVANTLTGTLDTQNLVPGVYCISTEAKTGTLTLTGSAKGTWTFIVNGYLEATNFNVVMAGGALACNVTWWVESYAAITTSAFQGNILAGTYIELTGGTFNGSALSQAYVTSVGTAVTAHPGKCPTK